MKIRHFLLLTCVLSARTVLGQLYVNGTIAGYDLTSGCGATAREERRWSGDDDIAGLELNFAEELAYIYEWLDLRLGHLDRFFSDPVSVADIPASTTQEKAFTPFGMPANHSYRDIVIKKGKKFLSPERQK